MVRKLLRKQLDAIRDGRDPAGLVRDPNAPPIRFAAGNFLLQRDSTQPQPVRD